MLWGFVGDERDLRRWKDTTESDDIFKYYFEIPSISWDNLRRIHRLLSDSFVFSSAVTPSIDCRSIPVLLATFHQHPVSKKHRMRGIFKQEENQLEVIPHFGLTSFSFTFHTTTFSEGRIKRSPVRLIPQCLPGAFSRNMHRCWATCKAGVSDLEIDPFIMVTRSKVKGDFESMVMVS